QPLLGFRPRQEHRRQGLPHLDELRRPVAHRTHPMMTRSASGSRLRQGARRLQGGLTLIGLLFLAVVIIVVGVIALRVVPSALEYMAIRNAVEKVVDSGAQTTRDLQMEFDRQAAVDDI